MHPRFWVYRRSLSSDPRSAFRSNDDVMQRLGCCMSGLLGLVFLGLAVLSLFYPKTDGKLFLVFMGLFGIFEVICVLYSCVPWLYNRVISSDSDENEDSCSSLLSSDEHGYQEVPVHQGLVSYQVVSSEVPSYQSGPTFSAAPYCADGGYFPSLTCFRPLVNHDGVFGHRQIPIYDQYLMEPQLQPYSSECARSVSCPQKQIRVY